MKLLLEKILDVGKILPRSQNSYSIKRRTDKFEYTKM